MVAQYLFAVALVAVFSQSQAFRTVTRPTFMQQRTMLMSTATTETKTTTSSSTSLDTPFQSTLLPKLVEQSLVVFVVDTSMPGGVNRIAAVKGTVSLLLRDRVRCCVVACSGDDAEVVMQPTSSLLKANLNLPKMRKSIGANVGRGITLGLESSKLALTEGFAPNVVFAIVADSKAHGLYSETSDCDAKVVNKELLCDLELEEAASSLLSSSKQMNIDGMKFSSVIVDTDHNYCEPCAAQGASQQGNGKEWNEEGARLASNAGSEYFHAPNLSDTELVKILGQVQRR